jgi:hypothetical protein
MAAPDRWWLTIYDEDFDITSQTVHQSQFHALSCITRQRVPIESLLGERFQCPGDNLTRLWAVRDRLAWVNAVPVPVPIAVLVDAPINSVGPVSTPRPRVNKFFIYDHLEIRNVSIHSFSISKSYRGTGFVLILYSAYFTSPPQPLFCEVHYL